MKVAIDNQPLITGHKVRGIGMHTNELIRAIKANERLIDIKAVDLKKGDLSRYDIVHYPYFNPFFATLPDEKIKEQKLVVTIHDLIQLIYPLHYPPGVGGRIEFARQKKRLNNVDAVITISETSKKDIVRFLDINPNKVHVIYLAPRKVFKAKVTKTVVKNVKKKYKLPAKYILYVGDINYNKNIPTLIKACKINDLPLVIVGKQALDIENKGVDIIGVEGPRDWLRFLLNKPHPEEAHYQAILAVLDEKTVRTGFVDEVDLVAIYNMASVYCQPSFYEGFGLPVLEAMACGTPVVISQTQALVEVAGNAALSFNPKSEKDLAGKLNNLWKNKDIHNKYSTKGLKRANQFSWEKTAKGTVAIYKLLNNEK